MSLITWAYIWKNVSPWIPIVIENIIREYKNGKAQRIAEEERIRKEDEAKRKRIEAEQKRLEEERKRLEEERKKLEKKRKRLILVILIVVVLSIIILLSWYFWNGYKK